MNLPERHRVSGGKLLAGGFADGFNLGVAPSLAFYLS